jgi:hypothetical protein
MSRSNQQQLNDPATKILRWTSEKGCFQVYDRESGEKNDLKIPVSFVVLDELQSVKGWSTKYDGGIYANLWRGNEPGFFKVKVNQGGGNDFPIVGHWKSIKDRVENEGGKWVKVIYAMMKSKSGGYETVRIDLHGTVAYSFGLIKGSMDGAIVIKETYVDEKLQKKLRKEFLFPKFEKMKINDDVEQQAIIKDKELQEYLNDYFQALNTNASKFEQQEPEQQEPESQTEKKPTNIYTRDAGTEIDPVEQANDFAEKAIEKKSGEAPDELFDDDTGDLPF